MQLVIAVWISVTDIDNEGEQIVIMDRPGNNRKDQEKEAHHCHAPNQLNTIIYQVQGYPQRMRFQRRLYIF